MARMTFSRALPRSQRSSSILPPHASLRADPHALCSRQAGTPLPSTWTRGGRGSRKWIPPVATSRTPPSHWRNASGRARSRSTGRTSHTPRESRIRAEPTCTISSIPARPGFAPPESRFFSFIYRTPDTRKERVGASFRYTTDVMLAYRERFLRLMGAIPAEVVSVPGAGLALDHAAENVGPRSIASGEDGWRGSQPRCSWRRFLAEYAGDLEALPALTRPTGELFSDASRIGEGALGNSPAGRGPGDPGFSRNRAGRGGARRRPAMGALPHFTADRRISIVSRVVASGVKDARVAHE